MISKWGVEKFRSILEANLDLAPLTIFTGVNSSGKSSFLASIGMIAQSLNKDYIMLNGDYVELGNFEENYYNNDPKKTNTINIYFESEKKIYVDDNLLYNHLCKIIHTEPFKAPYIPRISSKVKQIKASGEINQSVEDEKNIDRYDDIYNTEDEDNCDEFDNICDIEGTHQEEADCFSVLLKCNLPEDDKLMAVKLEGQFDNKNEKNPKEIETSYLNSKERLKKIWDYYGSYFSFLNFRYLRPIRNPLKPLKQKPDGEDKYVNSDGSNTFAVLYEWYNKKVIECLSPDDNCEMKYDHNKMYPFMEVLNSWLKYFDLSDTCIVEPSEKIYKLEMYINHKPYDPSLLGTAISQVLSILVMCLTAPYNSTIIIQEPEAHCHPKWQSRLADFFIAMALSGRQCIIETHSEYIINQLRYRIIRSPVDKPLHENVKLYFVSKKDGISYFKDIIINEYAVLDEWPEDFFDETQLILGEIFEEARKKKEAHKKNE